MQLSIIKSFICFLKLRWGNYAGAIARILATDIDPVVGNSNWRDNHFTIFVTYLMPVCLIALVPGIYISLRDGYLFLAAFDLAVVIGIGCVIMHPGITTAFKKKLIIAILYVLAVVLMICFGLSGPGMVYLFGFSIFITLLFSTRAGFFSVILSALICIVCAVVIELRLFHSPLLFQYDLGAWIAISSNLIFLSWVSVGLTGYTITTLGHSLNKEVRLKNELLTETAQRQRSNELLRESEVHYKSLFFLNPSPMWVLDYDTQNFLQVNQATIQSYQYSDAEFLTMNIMDIKLDEDRQNVHNSLLENQHKGVPTSIFSKHRRKNGEEFPVEIVFNSFLYMGKRSILAIAVDISKQMEYIDAIEVQNKKLYQIAHVQSHLVRAPLARIMGLIRLISDDMEGNTDPELMAHLIESADSLDLVIRSTTDFTN